MRVILAVIRVIVAVYGRFGPKISLPTMCCTTEVPYMMKSGPKKKLTFCKKSALTLTYLQPHLYFCKFSNPQFLAQFNQVPLMPINQFLSSQTEAGHSQHTHIPCHSYTVSQIKLIVHFLDNLLPRQVERPDLVGK